jgi:hypothetical protein
MKGLPCGTFDKFVKRRNANKYVKKFRSWDQLIVILYGQLTGAKGLRPLTEIFNCHSSRHDHLGTSKLAPSTLGDANGTRSDAVFTSKADRKRNSELSRNEQVAARQARFREKVKSDRKRLDVWIDQASSNLEQLQHRLRLSEPSSRDRDDVGCSH